MQIEHLSKLVESVAAFRPDGYSENLTPCLLLPTGHGKTSLAAAIARRRNCKMVSILLHTGLPEDNTGMPKIIERQINGRSVFTMERVLPSWLLEAAEEPHVVLFDEIDKASDDVLAGVLTLLAERRLGGVSLHPDTLVIAAGQEIDPAAFLVSKTGEAISSRMVYFPLDPAEMWKFAESRFGMDLSFIPKHKMASAPLLPMPTPRQVSWALQFIVSGPGKNMPEEDVRIILRGLFQEPIIDGLLERAKTPQIITEDDLVEYYLQDPSQILDAPVGDAIHLLPKIILTGNAALFGAAFYRFTVLGSVDEYRMAVDTVIDYFLTHTEIGPDVPSVPDENVRRMGHCFNWVCYQFALKVNPRAYDYHKHVTKPKELDFLPDVPAGFVPETNK